MGARLDFERIKASNQTSWGEESRDSEERFFLETNVSRSSDLKHAYQVFSEMLKGLRQFRQLKPSITIFGSARFDEHHVYYHLARRTARELARRGFGIMTGGGPGIMEAANRGSKEVGGQSVGCNIKLPKEQRPNPYLDCWVDFKYFMVRKFMLAKYSTGFIAMPGGFGTLDELFEILTLIQTKKVEHFPVVLMGKEFWQPLRQLIEGRLVEAKTIDPKDIHYLYFTDSPKEAADFIQKVTTERFQFKFIKDNKIKSAKNLAS